MKCLIEFPKSEPIVAMTTMQNCRPTDPARAPHDRTFVATALRVYEIIGDKLVPLLIEEVPQK